MVLPAGCLNNTQPAAGPRAPTPGDHHAEDRRPFNGGWLLINFGWGFAVFAGVYVAFKSGAHINPAVTIGLFVAGRDFAPDVDPTFANMLAYWAAQLIGAFVGAVLAFLAFKKHFDEEADPGTKLAVFSTGPAVRSYGWNFITEVIGTFVLIFWILASGGTTTGLGPLVVTAVSSSGVMPRRAVRLAGRGWRVV